MVSWILAVIIFMLLPVEWSFASPAAQPQVIQLPSRYSTIYVDGLPGECSPCSCSLSCPQYGERQSTASARAVQWGDNSTTSKGERWLVVCPFEKRFETRDTTCSVAVKGTNAATKGPIDATVPVYMRTRVAFSLSAVDMAGGPAVANGTVAFFHGHGGQFIARGQLADSAAMQRCVAASTSPTTLQLRGESGALVASLPMRCTAVDTTTVDYATDALLSVATPLGASTTQVFNASLSGGETVQLGRVVTVAMMSPTFSSWTASSPERYCLNFTARTRSGEATLPARTALSIPRCGQVTFVGANMLCCDRVRTENDDGSILFNGIVFHSGTNAGGGGGGTRPTTLVVIFIIGAIAVTMIVMGSATWSILSWDRRHAANDAAPTEMAPRDPRVVRRRGNPLNPVPEEGSSDSGDDESPGSDVKSQDSSPPVKKAAPTSTVEVDYEARERIT